MCWIRVVEKRPGIAWYPSTSSYASTKKKKKKGIRRKECMHSFAIASITTEKCV